MKGYLLNLGITFESDHISIPEYVSNIKIDVGLSEAAPQTQIWLERDPGTYVFGFEPVANNVTRIVSGNSNWPVKLDPKFLNSRTSIIPCALYSSHKPQGMEINVTKEDSGCSSILMPNHFVVDHTETVPVWTLSNFLPLISSDRFPYLDHLKIDVQGVDFEVLKGAGKHLNRFLAVTIEIDLYGYAGSTNNYADIRKHLWRAGFVRIKRYHLLAFLMNLRGVKLIVEVDDPTYINLPKLILCKNRKILLFQRG